MFDVFAAVWGANSSPGAWLLVFAGLLAAAAAATAAYVYFRTSTNSPHASGRLRDELCDAHGLSADDRQLISRAAAGVPHASAVFIDPSLLDRLAAADAHEAARCAELRERLFGA